MKIARPQISLTNNFWCELWTTLDRLVRRNQRLPVAEKGRQHFRQLGLVPDRDLRASLLSNVSRVAHIKFRLALGCQKPKTYRFVLTPRRPRYW